MKCPREFHDVQFSEDGIALISGITVKRWIAREGIILIALRRGFTAQRPVCELLSGVILFLFGGSTIVGKGSELFGPVILLLLLLAVVGCRLTFIALAQGLYLEVTNGTRRIKFPFRGKLQVERVESFLQSVEKHLDYTIERSDATHGFPIKLIPPKQLR